MGKALGAIDEIDPKTKSNIKAIDNTKAPSLFFNAKALGAGAAEARAENGQENTTPPEIADGKEPEQLDGVAPADDTTDADGTTPPEDVTEFKCAACGEKFASKKGLAAHSRFCNSQTDNE